MGHSSIVFCQELCFESEIVMTGGETEEEKKTHTHSTGWWKILTGYCYLLCPGTVWKTVAAHCAIFAATAFEVQEAIRPQENRGPAAGPCGSADQEAAAISCLLPAAALTPPPHASLSGSFPNHKEAERPDWSALLQCLGYLNHDALQLSGFEVFRFQTFK